MPSSLVLAWKETRAYYASPIAYVITAAFLGLTGHFFVTSITAPVPEASLRGMLTPITFGLVIWAPMVSMRLFAEEQKLGTLELLLTSPVRDWEIVVGKFVALAAMLLGIVVPTTGYVVLLYWFADPDFGPLMTGYLGLVLYGWAAGSLGLFVSSLTGSQIVAGAVAAVALFFLTLAAQAAELIEGLPATLLKWVSLPAHYTSFVEGVVELEHLTYFVTFIALFLLLTTLSLEARRWR